MNTMTLKGFAAVISGFSTLLDALRYSEVSDNLFDLYTETMRDQLPNKHYAYYKQDELRFVAIFDTPEERDNYVNRMWESVEELPSMMIPEVKSSLTCHSIIYAEFLKLADDEELNLNHYEVEDGLVIFNVTYGTLD